MKYVMLSEGDYSDYRVNGIMSREAPISAEDRVRMRHRYADLVQEESDEVSAYWRAHAALGRPLPVPKGIGPFPRRVADRWVDVLIAEFGFTKVEVEEISEGNV